jgi:hypothetical protein
MKLVRLTEMCLNEICSKVRIGKLLCDSSSSFMFCISSPSITRLIKSRRMIWTGNAARMRRINYISYWWETKSEIVY